MKAPDAFFKGGDIDNKQIKSVKFIPRTLVCNYKPSNNEYYLDRIRDTEDVITDYNLAPAQKLVNMFNNIFLNSSWMYKNIRIYIAYRMYSVYFSIIEISK